jgi:para-aminobenzoate synthetase component 2
VTHAEELMHGKTSMIEHDDSALFDGVPQRHDHAAGRSPLVAPSVRTSGRMPASRTAAARPGRAACCGSAFGRR